MNWRKKLMLWWKLLGVTDPAARKKVAASVGQRFKKRKPKRDKKAEATEAAKRG